MPSSKFPLTKKVWIFLHLTLVVDTDFFECHIVYTLQAKYAKLELLRQVEQQTLILNQSYKPLERMDSHSDVTLCQFSMTELSFLGHVISAEKIKPDPCKIELITNTPNPINLKELQ